MKSSRFRMLVAALTFTVLAAVGFSQTLVKTGRPGQRGAGFSQMLGFYADSLDLTDAQRTQMKDIMAKEKPTIQPLIEQLAQSHQQMRQLEASESFDEAKVRALATQQSQAMTELTVQKARIKSELMQLLTPDQKDKLSKFEARRQARFQKHFQQGQTEPSSLAAPNQ